MEFRPGEGLTGGAMQSGEPLWSQDGQKAPRVAHQAMWQGAGMRGIFVFPVVAENRAVGVLNFARPAGREPDERLLAASRVIGSQVGQFLQRKQAEESLRES